MNKKPLLLTAGIADLALSYVLFTAQQYFSAVALVGILVLVISGLALLSLPYYYHDEAGHSKRHRFTVYALLAISAIIILSEAYYDLAYMAVPKAALYISTTIAATAIFAIGAYLAKRYLPGNRSYKSYLMIFVLLAFLSVIIYFVQLYNVHATQWKGTDEMAFNYYSSYLLFHGANPYNSTMAPVLSSSRLIPTYYLNGTCECSYDYPALGFLLLSPLAVYKGFLDSYLFTGILVAVIVGFFIYKKSGTDNYALLPIATWFAAIFYFYPASTLTGLIAVSLLLLSAYIYRDKILLCGALIGLAVSVHQLAWFAAPFLFVIILREHGYKAALKSIAITALVFLVANCYFIALAPHKTLYDIFALFLTKLQFKGPSLVQLLVTFFPAYYWSLTAIIAIVFVAALVLFYFYNDTLRPLLAITPIAILFLSWRSTPEYTLVFLPLLICIYYLGKNSVQKDAIGNRKPILYAFAFIAVIAICIIVFAHFEYLAYNSLEISSVKYQMQSNITFGPVLISNIQINVANKGGEPQPIVFYMVSRNPDYSFYTVDSGMPELASNTNYTYVFPVTQLQFRSGTSIRVFVLDNDNIVSARIK